MPRQRQVNSLSEIVVQFVATFLHHSAKATKAKHNNAHHYLITYYYALLGVCEMEKIEVLVVHEKRKLSEIPGGSEQLHTIQFVR